MLFNKLAVSTWHSSTAPRRDGTRECYDPGVAAFAGAFAGALAAGGSSPA